MMGIVGLEEYDVCIPAVSGAMGGMKMSVD